MGSLISVREWDKCFRAVCAHSFFSPFFYFFYFYESLGSGLRPDDGKPEQLVLWHCPPIHPLAFVLTRKLPGKPTENLLQSFSEQPEENKALLKLVQYKPVLNPYNFSCCSRQISVGFATSVYPGTPDTRIGIELEGKVLGRELDRSKHNTDKFFFFFPSMVILTYFIPSVSSVGISQHFSCPKLGLFSEPLLSTLQA